MRLPHVPHEGEGALQLVRLRAVPVRQGRARDESRAGGEGEARGDACSRRDHGDAPEDPRRVPEVRPLRGVLGDAADPRGGRADYPDLPVREVRAHLAGILSEAPGTFIIVHRIADRNSWGSGNCSRPRSRLISSRRWSTWYRRSSMKRNSTSARTPSSSRPSTPRTSRWSTCRWTGGPSRPSRPTKASSGSTWTR